MDNPALIAEHPCMKWKFFPWPTKQIKHCWHHGGQGAVYKRPDEHHGGLEQVEVIDETCCVCKATQTVRVYWDYL